MKNTTRIEILIVIIFCILVGIIITISSLTKRIIIIENNLKEPINFQLQESPERTVDITPEMYAIVKCESQWNPEATGDGGKAHGYAQFWKETFNWLAKLSGEKLDYDNPGDQLWLLKWALENNRAYLWTCARNLGIN